MRAGKRSAQLLSILLLSWSLFGVAETYSQRLFVNAGANVASESIQSSIAGTNAAVQGGVQLESSEYVRLRLGATYQSIYSIDGMLQLHYLGDSRIRLLRFRE